MTETDDMTITSEYADFQPVYKQDDYTLASESSVTSETSPTNKKQRNYMDAYLLNDKSYHKMTRNGGSADEKVGVYSTSTTPGASIRDAITGGTSQMCRVGSIYEDAYGKINKETGEREGGKGLLSAIVSNFPMAALAIAPVTAIPV